MNKSKRELLKGMAVGSVWVTPTVSSILLPAHAQTSLVCSTDFCVSSEVENEDDAVYLLFDGTSCSFVRFDCCDESDLPESGGDRIIMLDLDTSNTVNWDANDAGDDDATIPIGDDNWDVTPNPGDDNSSGVFNLTAERLSGPNAGSTYQISLNVVLSGPGNDDGCIDITATISQIG